LFDRGHKPEVDYLDATIPRNHHVVRLEVPVDYARRVGRRHSLGDLKADRQQPADGQSAARNLTAEAALNQL
jgi:hypothetical protein